MLSSVPETIDIFRHASLASSISAIYSAFLSLPSPVCLQMSYANPCDAMQYDENALDIALASPLCAKLQLLMSRYSCIAPFRIFRDD